MFIHHTLDQPENLAKQNTLLVIEHGYATQSTKLMQQQREWAGRYVQQHQAQNRTIRQLPSGHVCEQQHCVESDGDDVAQGTL
jgi:uncharacterized protein YeaC (DUF1315 family)